MNQHHVPATSLLGGKGLKIKSPFFIKEVIISECPPPTSSNDIELLEEVSSKISQNSESDSQDGNVEIDSRKRVYTELNNETANEITQSKKRIKVLYPKRTLDKKKEISKVSLPSLQKQKVIQNHQPPTDHNNDCSNMFGFRVSMKSLLQNERIRQQLAPFIEKEVILVDCSDSDISKKEVSNGHSLPKKNQPSIKKKIRNKANPFQENEQIENEEPHFMEIIIPESSHAPDTLEVEENITIGDNINLLKDIAEAEESIDNNLPIIKEVTSIRDDPITYTGELPDAELSNIAAVEETGNIIENVIENIIEKSLTEENGVIKNKTDSNDEVVAVLDLIESSDDEVIICPNTEKSNEKVPKMTSYIKKPINKIAKRKRKSYYRNNDTVGNNSVIVLENEATENIDTKIDEDHDTPILDSDDWYYLNIANNPEAVQIENSELVTENSITSSLYESEQDNERIKTEKVKVLTVKRKRRKGRVSMPKKQRLRQKTKPDSTDIELDKKSTHSNLPNIAENKSNMLNNAKLPMKTTISTGENEAFIKHPVFNGESTFSENSVTESIENRESSSDDATAENWSNLHKVASQLCIKQEKVTSSPSKAMTEIPNLVYDNMRDYRQFLVVKRRVLIHNSGLRKAFSRRRRSKFASSNARPVRQVQNDGGDKEKRKRQPYKKRIIDRSNMRQSKRIKKLLGSKISLDNDSHENKKKRKYTKYTKSGVDENNATITQDDDDLNTKVARKPAKRGFVGQCSKCGKPYEVISFLRRHELKCTDAPSKMYNRNYSVLERIFYKCVMCSYKSYFKETFKKHISKHIMGTEKQLQQTLEKLENRTSNKPRKGRKKKNLVTNEKPKDTKNASCPENQMVAFCPTCEKDTPAVEDATHCKNCRTKFIFWCALCRSDFPTYQNLQMHVLRNLVTKLNGRGCSGCGERVFVSACAQARHQVFCKANEQCQGIPYVRLIRGEVLMKVVEAPPYTLQSYCLECNVKKIAFEKKEECAKCGFLLKFKCNICKKELVTYSDLQTHVKNVHGIDSHQCLECGQVFGHKTLLSKHSSYCNKTCGYCCVFCDDKQNSQDLLISHIERCHINKENDEIKCLDYDRKQIVSNAEKFSFMERQFLRNRKPPMTNHKQFEKERSVSMDNKKQFGRGRTVSKDNKKEFERQRSVSTDNKKQLRKGRTVSKDNKKQSERERTVSKDNKKQSERERTVSDDNKKQCERERTISNDNIKKQFEKKRSVFEDNENQIEREKTVSEDKKKQFERERTVSEDKKKQFERERTVSEDSEFSTVVKKLVADLEKQAEKSRSIRQRRIILPEDFDIHQDSDDNSEFKNNEFPSDKVIVKEVPSGPNLQPSKEIQNIQLPKLSDAEGLENIHSEHSQPSKEIQNIQLPKLSDVESLENIHSEHSQPSKEIPNIQLPKLSDVESLENIHNEHSQPAKEIQNIKLPQILDTEGLEKIDSQHSQPLKEIPNIEFQESSDLEALEEIHNQHSQPSKEVSNIPFSQSLDTMIVEDVNTSRPSEELEGNSDSVEDATNESSSLLAMSAISRKNLNCLLARVCKQCNEIYKSMFSWRQHRKKPRNCLKCKSPLGYQCLRCELILPHYALMAYHVRNKCKPSKSASCPKCSFTCDHPVDLKTHMKTHVRRKHGTYVDCQRCEGNHIRLAVAELTTCNIKVDEAGCENEVLVCLADLLKAECEQCMTSSVLPKTSRVCESCMRPFVYRCLMCSKRLARPYLEARHHLIDTHLLHSPHTQAGRELLERETKERGQPATTYECLDCGLKFNRLARFTRHIELTCTATLS